MTASRSGDLTGDGAAAGNNVAVVIVNYRTSELTSSCLAALSGERALLPNLRAIVVDGGSGDASADKLAATIAGDAYRDWVELLPLPINGGFGWANNQAICRLLQQPHPPRFIHLLNPDTEVEAGAVDRLLKYLECHPNAAAVGSQLLEPDGTWTGSAFSFPSVRGEFSRGARTGALDRLFRVPPVSVRTASPIEVDWATGASVMFRAEALREVGLFDEGFFLYHEEIELMWRLRLGGWTIATDPRSRVRHVGGGATGVHSRKTTGLVEPRMPRYWYRSRSRFFSLTRGRTAATVAFFSWIIGHCFWRMRKAVGLAGEAKAFDHQFRDHLAYAFPRRHDFVAAPVPPSEPATTEPAWMSNGWL